MNGLVVNKKSSDYSFLLVLIILGGPIIDLLTGYFTYFLNVEAVTPGIILRGGVILPILFWLSLKSRSLAIAFIYTGVLLVGISICYNLLAYQQVDIPATVNRFLKIIYPFVGLGALVYIHKKEQIDKEKLWKLGYYYGLITAIGVIVFTIFGFSIQSYVHQAYTSSGIFGAANDTGLVILLSFCFFLFYNQEYQSKRFLKLGLVTPVYFGAAILISTRAPLMGLPIALFILVGFSLFSRERKLTLFNKFMLVGLLAIFILVGVYVLNFLIQNDFVYALNRIQQLAGGRFEGRGRVANGIAFIFEYNIIEHLFGAGEARFALVENDIVDLYGKFGILFLMLVMGTSLFFLIRIYSVFFTKRNLATLSLSLALTYYIFHGAVAGHAFTSAQVNNLIMVVYFLTYLYARELKLHRKIKQLIQENPQSLHA